MNLHFISFGSLLNCLTFKLEGMVSFNITHYQFDEACVVWAHYIKHILWDCVRNQRVTSLVFEDKIGFQKEFQLRTALSHILKN